MVVAQQVVARVVLLVVGAVELQRQEGRRWAVLAAQVVAVAAALKSVLDWYLGVVLPYAVHPSVLL